VSSKDKDRRGVVQIQVAGCWPDVASRFGIVAVAGRRLGVAGSRVVDWSNRAEARPV
jgi:hypothetical protein